MFSSWCLCCCGLLSNWHVRAASALRTQFDFASFIYLFFVYSKRRPVYSGRSFQCAFDEAAGFLQQIELSASDGTIMKVPYVPLVRCIEFFEQASAGFRHLLRKTILSSNCCPLTLVWYNDGIVPGNALSPDPQRKSVMFYASFLEFGHYIRSEHAWFPLGVIRESELKLTRDGLPGYFTSLVKTIFPPVSNFTVGGEPFTVDGEILLLRIKGMAFVADEGAIKTTFDHKGIQRSIRFATLHQMQECCESNLSGGRIFCSSE